MRAFSAPKARQLGIHQGSAMEFPIGNTTALSAWRGPFSISMFLGQVCSSVRVPAGFDRRASGEFFEIQTPKT